MLGRRFNHLSEVPNVHVAQLQGISYTTFENKLKVVSLKLSATSNFSGLNYIDPDGQTILFCGQGDPEKGPQQLDNGNHALYENFRSHKTDVEVFRVILKNGHLLNEDLQSMWKIDPTFKYNILGLFFCCEVRMKLHKNSNLYYEFVLKLTSE